MSAKADRGYSEDNVMNSIPSLREGKLLSKGTANWMDVRELYMAKENLLKTTEISYKVEPDRGVNAVIKATAPRGDKLVSLSMDNYGNDLLGRGRVSFFALNSNLTGRDDMLSLSGTSSTNTFLQSYGVQLRYSIPFYESHNFLTMNYSHGQSNVNVLPVLTGGVNSYGSSDQLAVKLTHYLTPFDWQTKNQFKVSAGLGWNQYSATAKWNSYLLQDFELKTTPVTLGVSGTVNTANALGAADIDMALDFVAAGAGVLGTSDASTLGQSRVGASSYEVARYNVGVKQELKGGYLNGRLFGQYTEDNLIPYESMGIAGIYGVRGFVNAVSMGDVAYVMRLEAFSPNLFNKEAVRIYSFYDMGRKWGGADEVNASLSSWGIGVRASSASNRISFDAFVAEKLSGNQYDIKVNGSGGTVDRVTYWLTGTLNY